MDLLTPPRVPTVTTLPAAGSRGRLLTLSSDGHLYHDNVSAWDDLTAQGAGGSGGLVLLSTVVANTSGSVLITAGLTSSYDNFILMFSDAYNALANADLLMRMNYGAGYPTTGYDFTLSDNTALNTTQTNYNAGGNAPQITLMKAQYGGTLQMPYDGIVQFNNPALSGRRKLISWDCNSFSSSGYVTRSKGVGFHANDETPLVGIAIYPAAGNIKQGNFRLYGVQK